MQTGLVVCILAGALLIGGCEGTDTRSKVDDTVEELSGKKNLDRYQRVKGNIADIKTQRTKNYDRLDDHQNDD